MNRIKAIKNNLRLIVQTGFTALTNGYAYGFLNGKIYRGKLKNVCVPGLNCYSCPGALGSCPIGSLQAVIGSRNYKFSFYVIGFLMIIGSLMGRFVCGWLCPFGLVQDLIYKIPPVAYFRSRKDKNKSKKIKKKQIKIPGDRYLRYLKYVILIGFVIILPMFALGIGGQGDPWFCKYICPSGTLFGGIPLVAANESLQSAIGFLFAWKNFILIFLLVLSFFIYRPFCKYLCPLGAVYGLFNSFALYRYSVNKHKCTSCGVCSRACKMNIAVYEKPNSTECIRCGKCVSECPHGAINTSVKKGAKVRLG